MWTLSFSFLLHAQLLKEVMERMWLLVDPGPGQLEAPHPLPCLWNVHASHCSHTRSSFLSPGLERSRCCWHHLDRLWDWTLWEPFFKILEDWYGDLLIFDHSKQVSCIISLACFYLFIFSSGFLELHPWHMEVPRLGGKSELKLLAYTTAHGIGDMSATYTTAHGNDGSPTHGVRPGFEPTCVLVRCVTDEPRWELHPLLVKPATCQSGWVCLSLSSICPCPRCTGASFSFQQGKLLKFLTNTSAFHSIITSFFFHFWMPFFFF